MVHMENNYEHSRLSVGHEGLFGSKISQEELIDIISRYPATLWLDLFSKIEGFLIIPRGKDFNAQKFLVDNLFCPSALERTQRKANAGDVVLISGKGTDPYIMETNGKKTPWDDATVVREELEKVL